MPDSSTELRLIWALSLRTLKIFRSSMYTLYFAPSPSEVFLAYHHLSDLSRLMNEGREFTCLEPRLCLPNRESHAHILCDLSRSSMRKFILSLVTLTSGEVAAIRNSRIATKSVGVS